MEFFLVRIQSECGKIRNRKISVFGHFSRSDHIQKLCVHLLITTCYVTLSFQLKSFQEIPRFSYFFRLYQYLFSLVDKKAPLIIITGEIKLFIYDFHLERYRSTVESQTNYKSYHICGCQNKHEVLVSILQKLLAANYF